MRNKAINKKVISAILNQKGNFTKKDILISVGDCSFSKEDLVKIIDEKIDALCEVNLIKDTILYYYVR